MESQTDKLYNILSDYQPHSTSEIIEKVYPAEGRLKTPARISARIYDVKYKYGVNIESWQDKNIEGLWWYQIKTSPNAKFATLNESKPSERLPATHCEELASQPRLFALPEVEQKMIFVD